MFSLATSFSQILSLTCCRNAALFPLSLTTQPSLLYGVPIGLPQVSLVLVSGLSRKLTRRNLSALCIADGYSRSHEAGHQAYSSSKTINNAVGWVLHSALLVPYHSWRISHGRHHAATGHLTRDEVFVPRTRKQLGYPEVEEEGEILGMKCVQDGNDTELRAYHVAVSLRSVRASFGRLSRTLLLWYATTFSFNNFSAGLCTLSATLLASSITPT